MLRTGIGRRLLASAFFLSVPLALLPAFVVPGALSKDVQTQVQRPAQWAQPVDPENNLYRITPGLYRSALLTPDMLPRLKQWDIRTVINLRAQHDDEKILRDTGILRVDIPMRTWDIDDDKIVAALRAIREAERRGAVLFHCQHGADRTGVVAAMYRMVFQGWSREAALTELENGGYGFHSIWTNIPRYVRETDVEAVRSRVLAPDE